MKSYELVFEKEWSYRLLKSKSSEQYFLEVLCGGIGMYEVIIELDTEEIDRLKDEGERFIEDLAYKIGKNNSKYSERSVKITFD